MRAIPSSVQRWMVILMPPMALLVCCLVIVPRQNKLRAVNKDIKFAQVQVADYVQKLDAIRSLPPDPTVATLPMSNQEQSNFLRGLSQLCARTGNSIMSVDQLAPPAAKPNAPPPAPGANAPKVAGALPPEVLPIESNIKFEGTFNSLRAFLRSLQSSRRLISLSELKVGSAEAGFPTLQCQLIITRYVDTPAHLLPPPAPGGATKS